jgi:hypothetical protein
VSTGDTSEARSRSNELTEAERRLLQDIVQRPWKPYGAVLISTAQFLLRSLPITVILAAFVFGAGSAPDEAGQAYFSAAAQVIPVLLLALAVESRLLSFESLFRVQPTRMYSEALREAMRKGGKRLMIGAALSLDSAMAWAAAVFNAVSLLASGVAVLAILSFAEWECLRVLAAGDRADPYLVSGGILAGLVGVGVIALIGRAKNATTPSA